MNIYSIYRATNVNTKKCYIGFTSFNIDHRKKGHYINAFIKNINNKFYNSLRKHGAESFIWETIYQSLDKDYTLNTMENYFIIEYDSFYNGYNSTFGGGGSLGRIINGDERTKKRITAITVYSKMTTEEKQKKFGRSGNQNSFFNKKHSVKSIEQMQLSHSNQRSKKILCSVCGNKYDSQNYSKHHGENCGRGKDSISGRKWFFSGTESYYLYPTDEKIHQLNLSPGRSPLHKRRTKKS